MHVPFSHLPAQFPQKEVDDILNKIEEAVLSYQFTLGPQVEEFEQAFAKRLGVAHAIGVASGTDAIKLALKAYGIRAADQVIIPANTFIATAGAVIELGAVPVIVDVLDDFTIDPVQVEQATRGRVEVKAIIPVHLNGYPCDMADIMDLAERYELVVVEDACQAVMATVAIPGFLSPTSAKITHNVGTIGHAGAFSLHPLKNLNVWGDGGVIVTDNPEKDDWLRRYRNHGLLNRDRVSFPGVNSRLDTLQAVVALHGLHKLDEITSNRGGCAEFYLHGLKEMDEDQMLRLPPNGPDRCGVWHLFQILVDEDKRDDLVTNLEFNGIEAKVHYPHPQVLQIPSKYIRVHSSENAIRHSQRTISLPCHEGLTEDQQRHVVDTIKEFYTKNLVTVPPFSTEVEGWREEGQKFKTALEQIATCHLPGNVAMATAKKALGMEEE